MTLHKVEVIPSSANAGLLHVEVQAILDYCLLINYIFRKRNSTLKFMKKDWHKNNFTKGTKIRWELV